MDGLLITIASMAAGGLLFIFWLQMKKKPGVIATSSESIPGSYKQVLSEQVPFYQQLDETRKAEFEKRIQRLLSQRIYDKKWRTALH